VNGIQFETSPKKNIDPVGLPILPPSFPSHAVVATPVATFWYRRSSASIYARNQFYKWPAGRWAWHMGDSQTKGDWVNETRQEINLCNLEFAKLSLQIGLCSYVWVVKHVCECVYVCVCSGSPLTLEATRSDATSTKIN